ncbi:MAG TPA: hypothetical protein VFY48_01670 [Solirubrobacterales bacterium]|nr:hypothetical protein [Solirubrobacterales bacterium]
MKVKIALLATTALLATAGSAEAFKWHMSYGQAKNASKELAKELCDGVSECTGYGVGQCQRRSPSRFDCLIGLFSPGTEPGEEIQCDVVLHWGVNRGGAITLKNRGPFHCHVA